MNQEYWAHEGQPLPVHLLDVAKLADHFGSFFGAKSQTRLAGLLHDLGKAEDEFLKRICGEKGKEEPHAHHGAKMVLEDTSRGGPIWPVAFAINGHHAGLHDRHNLYKRRTEYAKAQAAERRLTASPHWTDQIWPLDTFGKNLPQLPQNFQARPLFQRSQQAKKAPFGQSADVVRSDLSGLAIKQTLHPPGIRSALGSQRRRDQRPVLDRDRGLAAEAARFHHFFGQQHRERVADSFNLRLHACKVTVCIPTDNRIS